jgi:hypothetical protein
MPIAESRKNWEKVPPELREKCVKHLRDNFTQSVYDHINGLREREGDDWPSASEVGPEDEAEMILKYGFCVPSPFHFGTGMAIRNLLREVVKDAELPPVDYDDQPMQNWDDYYIAAVEEALDAE